MKILYVEHKAVDADLTLRHLRGVAPHFACEVVGTIEEALRRLERPGNRPFDLLLTDMDLPDGSGLSLVTHVRGRALPVATVVLTGTGDEETAAAILKAGADDYMVKHHGYLESLALAVESAFHHYRARAARRARLLRVLYVEHGVDADLTRQHFDRHAAHIHLDILPSAADALQRLHRGNGASAYDVLLLDHPLPGVNALELRQQLRLACKITPPVVLVTRESSGEAARQAVHLGAASYVVKNPGYLFKLTAELENASFCAELIRREETLQANQERYKLAAAAGGVAVWELDLETGKVLVDSATPIFLPSQDVLTFDQCLHLIHPDDRKRAVEHRRRCLDSVRHLGKEQSLPVPEISLRICRTNEDIRWVLVRGTLLSNDNGRPCRVLGTVTDVTDRKKAEVGLRETEDRLMTIMNHSPASIFLKDTRGCYLYVNPAFERNFREKKEHILGKTDFEIFAPEQAAAFTANDRQVFEDGAPRTFEEIAAREDGPQTSIVHKFPLLDKDGRIHAIAGIVTDITDRKRAEEKLKEREERFRMALDAGRMGVWDWEPISGKLTWSNEYFTLMGVDPSSGDPLTYSSWAKLVHPEDYPRAKECMETAIAEKKLYHCEYRVVRPDGSHIWVGGWGEPMFDKNGECVRVMGVIRDITEQKRAEHSLRAALTELGQLKAQVEAENVYLRKELKGSRFPEFYIGESAGMTKVRQQVDQVAGTDMTVLIVGETGVGKELVARAVHQNSSRRDKPLVTVNCSALPAELVESELFGHEKGAFTGATTRQPGRFELAHEGTLFLDEIGELPLHLQAKLLRSLQEGEFERLGSGKSIKVNVRVIAATNRDLGEAIKKGEFRTDLFYRLNVFPIHVPPLRERKRDIGGLAALFLKEACVRMGRPAFQLSREVLAVLENYDWPGNVRELRNVIERTALSSTDGVLQLEEDSLALLRSRQRPETPSGLNQDDGVRRGQNGTQRTTLKELERDHILRVLEQAKWRIEGPKGAAIILGLRPSTLRSRMRKYGIP